MDVFHSFRGYFKMAGIHDYISDPSDQLVLIRFSQNARSLITATPVYRNDFFEVSLSSPQDMRFSVSGTHHRAGKAPSLTCIAPLEIQECSAASYTAEVRMLLAAPRLIGVSDYGSPFYKKYTLFNPAAPSSRFLSPEAFSLIENTFDKLQEEARYTTDPQRAFERFHATVAGAVQSPVSLPRKTSRKQELFNRFLYRLKTGSVEEHSIKEIARELTVSYTHLSDTIKEVSSAPPSAHRSKFLNALAKTYLAATDLPASRIALELGFSSPAHYTTFFKRMNRTTPGSFRNKPKIM